MKVQKETTKKKRVSKKTKRSWRKHVDTGDVDEYLESARQEERLGSFAGKTDAELFAVDTEPRKTSKKQRRELLMAKQPKCFDILQNRSSVQDPIRVRNRVRTPEERKDPISKRKEAQRKARGILKLKERVALANREVAKARRLMKHRRGEYKNDAWEVTTQDTITSEWLSSADSRHTLKHVAGVTKRLIPESIRKKPSALSAVQAPHPGESYNPSYQDHQDLLRTIAEKEAEIIKKEKHLDRVTSHMFKKISPEEQERRRQEEIREGLDLDGETTQEPEKQVDDDPVVRSVNPPVRNKKKTLVQRRKQREQKQLQQALRRVKLEKRKVTDIYALRRIQAGLKNVEEKQKVVRERRIAKRKERKETGPKILSKTKFEPAEPDFKLSHELTGTLRGNTPAGSVLRDRFKSLQERGIIAPTQRKLKMEKPKVKRYIKADHKINVEAYLKTAAA